MLSFTNSGSYDVIYVIYVLLKSTTRGRSEMVGHEIHVLLRNIKWLMVCGFGVPRKKGNGVHGKLLSWTSVITEGEIRSVWPR
jgi:hypothetical protein